jgi:hypothetical protein
MGCVLGSIQETEKCIRLGAKKVAKFANLTNDSNWEMFAQCRKVACIAVLYKAYSTEPAWETIGDRLQRPYYISQFHDWKIRKRRQTMDMDEYSFVNRNIQFCNKLPMSALGTFLSILNTFRKRVRKVVGEVKRREFEVRRK